MNAELLGFILDVIGKIMIAFTAIPVHRRFQKERKMDKTVFKAMNTEQFIGIAGIIFLFLKASISYEVSVKAKLQQKLQYTARMAYSLYYSKKIIEVEPR